jgi:hypothetical protein
VMRAKPSRSCRAGQSLAKMLMPACQQQQ